MKKLLLSVGVLGLMTALGWSQRFAYVDIEYILNHIPEYHEAQKKLDEIAAQWQKQIEERYQEIDRLYRAYQAEQVLLTEQMRRKREEEILQKEREVKELQRQKFGYQGELFQKRQELVKPIQDKVYDAIDKMAKEKRLDFVFDKSAGTFMLYANNVHDRSDDVIRALGYTPGKTKME